MSETVQGLAHKGHRFVGRSGLTGLQCLRCRMWAEMVHAGPRGGMRTRYWWPTEGREEIGPFGRGMPACTGESKVGDIARHRPMPTTEESELPDRRVLETLLVELHARIRILEALIDDPPDYHEGLDRALRARGCRPREGCDWLGRRVTTGPLTDAEIRDRAEVALGRKLNEAEWTELLARVNEHDAGWVERGRQALADAHDNKGDARR